MDTWITMLIEVNNARAKLFLDNNTQPALIVNDLKLCADAAGGIALCVDIGIEGYFSDLKISAW